MKEPGDDRPNGALHRQRGWSQKTGDLADITTRKTGRPSPAYWRYRERIGRLADAKGNGRER